MIERAKIEALIIESVQMLAEDFALDALKSPQAETPLYGESGALDSMALVNLIADIEEALAEKYDLSIALADEKAMSARNSPYRTIDSLVEAVIERLPE